MFNAARWTRRRTHGTAVLATLGLGCHDANVVASTALSGDSSAATETTHGSTTGATTDTGGTTGAVTSSSDDGASESGTGLHLDVGVDTDGHEGCSPCVSDNTLIYLIDDEGATLWTFNPTNLETLPRADLSACLPGGVRPFSMAVARDRTGTIMADDGKLYEFAIPGPQAPPLVPAVACLDRGYEAGQLDVGLFAPAYVTTQPGSNCEQLFFHSWSGGDGWGEGRAAGKLGRIDDLKAIEVGILGYDGGELSGNAEGRLFAFAGVAPAKLIEYDKESAERLDVLRLTGLDLGQSFAFAFWGGDFYLFTFDPFAGDGTMPAVPHVAMVDYDGDQAITDLGVMPMVTVGAAVSTCAPIEPEG